MRDRLGNAAIVRQVCLSGEDRGQTDHFEVQIAILLGRVHLRVGGAWLVGPYGVLELCAPSRGRGIESFEEMEADSVIEVYRSW